jgi:hypothetical protein
MARYFLDVNWAGFPFNKLKTPNARGIYYLPSEGCAANLSSSWWAHEDGLNSWLLSWMYSCRPCWTAGVIGCCNLQFSYDFCSSFCRPSGQNTRTPTTFQHRSRVPPGSKRRRGMNSRSHILTCLPRSVMVKRNGTDLSQGNCCWGSSTTRKPDRFKVQTIKKKVFVSGTWFFCRMHDLVKYPPQTCKSF